MDISFHRVWNGVFARVVFSWEFGASIIISIVIYWLAPVDQNAVAKDIYSIGINILAILFSIYFAALIFIISSTNDDFVHFMEVEGDYSLLISLFKYCLFILFIALLYSTSIYAVTSVWNVDPKSKQPAWTFSCFCFLFLWGVSAALSSTQHAIEYANHRVKYLMEKKKQ